MFTQRSSFHPVSSPSLLVGRDHDDGHDLLVSLVDFKWLMAARGMRVDIERIGLDQAYADQCLRLGMGSGCEALRARSASLVSHLARALVRQRTASPSAPSSTFTGP